MKFAGILIAAALLSGCALTKFEKKLANGDSAALTSLRVGIDTKIGEMKIGDDYLKGSSTAVNQEAAGKMIEALKLLVVP
jgi:hypothetical protein